MTKTKDELIEGWWVSSRDPIGDHYACYKRGALEMYDHRQKEIDELRNQLAKSEAETVCAQRWWAGKYIAVKKANGNPRGPVAEELNAAAAKVLDDGFICCKCGLIIKGRPYHYTTEICEGVETKRDVCVSCFDYEAKE